VHKAGADYEVIDKPVEFKTGEIVEVIAGDIGRSGQDRLVALHAPEVAAAVVRAKVPSPAPPAAR
jgi:hypothetical protein